MILVLYAGNQRGRLTNASDNSGRRLIFRVNRFWILAVASANLVIFTQRYPRVRYLGIDIVPQFIKEGRKKYPYLDLKVADYLQKPKLGNFDIVVASGILNSNLGKIIWNIGGKR